MKRDQKIDETDIFSRILTREYRTKAKRICINEWIESKRGYLTYGRIKESKSKRYTTVHFWQFCFDHLSFDYLTYTHDVTSAILKRCSYDYMINITSNMDDLIFFVNCWYHRRIFGIIPCYSVFIKEDGCSNRIFIFFKWLKIKTYETLSGKNH